MSARKRRVFDREFKLSAVDRLRSGELIGALSAELGVSKVHLYKWRLQVCRGGRGALRGAGRPRKLETAGPPGSGDVAAARKRLGELELAYEEQHGERLARALGVPDHPAPALASPATTSM